MVESFVFEFGRLALMNSALRSIKARTHVYLYTVHAQCTQWTVCMDPRTVSMGVCWSSEDIAKRGKIMWLNSSSAPWSRVAGDGNSVVSAHYDNSLESRLGYRQCDLCLQNCGVVTFSAWRYAHSSCFGLDMTSQVTLCLMISILLHHHYNGDKNRMYAHTAGQTRWFG